MLATRPLLLIVAGLAWCGQVAMAEIVTFDLDPAQSPITISGSTVGATFQEQGPGSLTTRFTGSLLVDLTGTSIEFKSGSAIDAQTNGVWSPLPDGSEGTAPADFGAQGANFFATADAALRNIFLDAFSPFFSLQGGNFDSSGLVFEFPVGGTASLDYRVTGIASASGTKALETLATNEVTATGTVLEQNGIQTLTIPVDATFTLDLLSPGDTMLTITGSLVATRNTTPAVVFDANSLAVSGTDITLHWSAAPGQTFQIQSTTDFTVWSNRASNITSANSDYSWTGATVGPLEYFRLAY